MNDQRKVIFEQRLELMQRRDGRRDHRRHAPFGDRRTGRQAHSGERLSRAVGHRRPRRPPCARCSRSTCRCRTGPRKKASPTRKCASASRGAPTSAWRRKVAKWGPDVMRYVEKSILLQTLDHLWREHLVMLDHLRQVIGLRGYGQRDPLNEYKAEAFELFEAMVAQSARGGDRPAHAGRDRCSRRRRRTSRAASLHGGAQGRSAHRRGRDGARRRAARRPRWPAPAMAATAARRPSAIRNDPTTWGKVGRNEPCPCGSGKKFKHCHGQIRCEPSRSPIFGLSSPANAGDPVNANLNPPHPEESTKCASRRMGRPDASRRIASRCSSA